MARQAALGYNVETPQSRIWEQRIVKRGERFPHLFHQGGGRENSHTGKRRSIAGADGTESKGISEAAFSDDTSSGTLPRPPQFFRGEFPVEGYSPDL